MSERDKANESAGSGTHATNSPAAGQLPLLPGETVEQRDALLPLPQAAKLKPEPSGRGVGRPLHARNRRTDLMAQYLVTRYGDPLEADVAFGTMPLIDAIRELRVVASDGGMRLDLSVRDILQLQADARGRALPYIHAKRAPEDHKGDPVLPVVGIGRAENVQIIAGGVSIEDRLAQAKTIDNIEENKGDAK